MCCAIECPLYMWIQFWWTGVFIRSGPMFKIKLASTEYSRSVLVNTMIGLFDVIDDPSKMYELIVIWNDSGVLGNCLKTWNWFL